MAAKKRKKASAPKRRRSPVAAKRRAPRKSGGGFNISFMDLAAGVAGAFVGAVIEEKLVKTIEDPKMRYGAIALGSIGVASKMKLPREAKAALFGMGIGAGSMLLSEMMTKSPPPPGGGGAKRMNGRVSPQLAQRMRERAQDMRRSGMIQGPGGVIQGLSSRPVAPGRPVIMGCSMEEAFGGDYY